MKVVFKCLTRLNLFKIKTILKSLSSKIQTFLNPRHEYEPHHGNIGENQASGITVVSKEVGSAVSMSSIMRVGHEKEWHGLEEVPVVTTGLD